MAIACALVATPLQVWRRIGFTSFPFVPSPAAAELMGLGTLYPPEVVWERCEINDMRILTSCPLATAPLQRGRQA